jgi:cation:H+ antiporter
MIELVAVQLIILSISLVLLASASHFTMRSVEDLIALTGLSDVSAGFVILAVMTSTPEIFVALFSVLQGNPGISIGDILGSNIFNTAAVLGILGTLGYLKTCCTDLLVELTDILLVITLIPLLLVISHYHIFDISSPIIGIILLTAFFMATYFMAKKKTPPVKADAYQTVAKKGRGIVVMKLLLSFSGVVIAAQLVVHSSSSIAIFLGIPPILIGAKLVSIGTSLPELTLDFQAVKRGRVQLAIGDIIGSNLTNLTLVLGLVLLSSPFSVEMTIFTEILPFLLIATVIFWRFLIKGGISQTSGIILIMIYVLFQAVT